MASNNLRPINVSKKELLIVFGWSSYLFRLRYNMMCKPDNKYSRYVKNADIDILEQEYGPADWSLLAVKKG